MSKWILISDTPTYFRYKCPECGCIILVDVKRDVPYGCPNCGIELEYNND